MGGFQHYHGSPAFVGCSQRTFIALSCGGTKDTAKRHGWLHFDKRHNTVITLFFLSFFDVRVEDGAEKLTLI